MLKRLRMRKDDKRRDFLKQVWAVPTIISFGALITPASAKPGDSKPGKPGKPGKK